MTGDEPWVSEYRAWEARVREAQVPVGISLAFLLFALVGMAAWTAALTALVVVCLGEVFGKVAWAQEHPGSFG